MSLRQLQSLFVKRVASLIRYAESQGYELTFGEAYRSPEEAARLAALEGMRAIKRSLHCDRLAIDLNLFKDGIWLQSTGDFQPLGAFWESLSTPDAQCVWGGAFSDGNHFSIAYQGRK